MKITVLSSTLSENALGRAYILAKALERNYEVEFIGLVTDKGVWPPCDTGEFPYIKIKKGNFFKNFFQIYQKISGDVVYAIKPLPASFGVALAAKVFSGKPLILDIDDWELGFNIQDYKEGKTSLLKFIRIYLTLATLEKLTFLANKLTTVSTFLNERFGNRGVFVPHGRDVEAFDLKKFDVEKTKKDLELTDKKVIMFLGSIKPHKGLEDLLSAAKLAAKKIEKLKVVLVGVNFQDIWTKKLIQENKNLVFPVGFIKFDEVPKYLAAADLVVLPQKDTLETKGQIPAKVFDAMSMAKPIISTDVSDIRKILDGCGVVIEPDNIEKLLEEIKLLLTDTEKAKELGAKAREKCVKEYSLKVMEDKLKDVFSQYEKKRTE